MEQDNFNQIMNHVYTEEYKELNWAQAEKIIRQTSQNMVIMEDHNIVKEIKVKRLGYTNWEISITVKWSEVIDCQNMTVFRVYADPDLDRYEITPIYSLSEHTSNNIRTGEPERYHVTETFACKPRDTSRKDCDFFIKRLKRQFAEHREVWKDSFVPGQAETFGKILLDPEARTWENIFKSLERKLG